MRLKKHKTVLAHGSFDMVHSGHMEYLKFARSHGDKLIIALSPDEMVRKRKGEGRPIQPYSERKAIQEALRYVDEVVEAPNPVGQLDGNLLACVKAVRPDVF